MDFLLDALTDWLKEKKTNHSPDGDFSVPVCSFPLKRQLLIFTCAVKHR